MTELTQNKFNGNDYYNLIYSDLKNMKNLVQSIEKQLARVNENEDVATIKNRITVLVNYTEKIALQGRAIPMFFVEGDSDVIKPENEIVTVKREGEILVIEAPLLFPRARINKANKSYLVSTYHEAFKTYFREHQYERKKEHVVIWFEFQYKKRKGRQGFRDHDNLETKVIKDLLAPYIVTDDGPAYCDDFNSSREGDYDATFIHIVPQSKFPDYYRLRVN